jgi:meiosis-specific protein
MCSVDFRSSLNLSVTSIASFLPSSTEQDDLAFAGTTTYAGVRPTLSPIQEATFCKQQAEKQREDAETRNIVWSVENNLELDDPDGDGDDDPEYVRLPDGRYEKISAISPIGIRNKDGIIEAMACSVPGQSSEAQFGGFSENVPIRLQDIVRFSF